MKYEDERKKSSKILQQIICIYLVSLFLVSSPFRISFVTVMVTLLLDT